MKKTLLLGATLNPSRYAFLAAQLLAERNIDFVPVGIRSGVLFGKTILDIKSKPMVEDVHTITMYIGPQHQPQWFEYLFQINPKRIIFNPGSENPYLEELLGEKSIEVIQACTLVLLRTDQY